MKKQMVIMLFLCMGTGIATAQNIEINDAGLKINAMRITERTTPAKLQRILGTPDRIMDKYQQVWTYHEQGVMVYVDRDDMDFSIILCYKPTQFDYAPACCYRNEIKIFDHVITPDSGIDDLKAIPEIIFEKTIRPGNYVATVSGCKLVIEAYSGRIETIELSRLR